MRKMMVLGSCCFGLLFILGQLILIAEAGNDIPETGQLYNVNVTNNTSSSSTVSAPSRWLKKVSSTNQRPTGCRNRPWICNQGEYPRKIKKLCCLNRCVDVRYNVHNCGLCGIRCPFTWQCCRGICIDTNMNPFHCGKCDHRCTFFSLCFYGMCGYAQPLPPFPFPPKPPKPPKPFPPKPPHPPVHRQSQPSG